MDVYLSVEYQNLEESVHQKNPVRLNGARIKQNRFRRPVEAVAVQNWLYHYQRLCQIFPHQHVTIEGCFIRRVVKHLQELRAAQVIHELRVQAEVLAQTEAVRVVFVILSEFLALKNKMSLCSLNPPTLTHQPNQHPIDPPQHVLPVVRFRPVNHHPRHDHRGALLVEPGADVMHVDRRVGPVPRNRRHPNPPLSRRVLILRDELDAAAATLRYRRRVLIDDFEE